MFQNDSGITMPVWIAATILYACVTMRQISVTESVKEKELIREEMAGKEASRAEVAEKELIREEMAEKEPIRAEVAEKEWIRAEVAEKEPIRAETAGKEAARADMAQKEPAKADAAERDMTRADTGTNVSVGSCGHLRTGSWFYITVMMLLGIATFLTDQSVMIWMNYIGFFVMLLLFLLHNFYDDSQWDFTKNMVCDDDGSVRGSRMCADTVYRWICVS